MKANTLRSLTWAVLQERITTTTYGPKSERWSYPLVLNTVQSTIASLVAYIYLLATTRHPHKPGRPAPIFPSFAIVKHLLLIAITSSLASPFGYASLKHVDYVTFILAKSCKLLPVFFLHIVLFRRKYPLPKYLVIILVTLGVSVFTLHSPSVAGKAAKHASKNASVETNKMYGLFLLGVNLLFDGLTNTVQDDIFIKYKAYKGSQMMCAMNVLATGLTSTYLLLAPYLAATPLGPHLGIAGDELSAALAFIQKYPQVGYDVLGFGLCGALGQVAIYYVLAQDGSLVLTTVTVTRKMLTMVLSVVWFGHRLTQMQWAGVGLVFGGIGAEAVAKRMSQLEKNKKKKDRQLSEAGQDRAAAGLESRKER